MSVQIKLTVAATALLGLAACSDQPAFSAWNQEAGAYLDSGTFGNATMNNTLVQTGELQHVVNLNDRFQEAVPTKVTFAFDSAILDGPARAAIAQQAHFIAQFPEVRFRVYGHTDLVGSESYNKALGLRRARAVVDELVRNGISRSRLEAVVSFGETRPLIATQDAERANRRTVTEVSGFLQDNQLVLDGKYMNIVYRQYVGSAGSGSALVDFGESQI